MTKWIEGLGIASAQWAVVNALMTYMGDTPSYRHAVFYLCLTAVFAVLHFLSFCRDEKAKARAAR